MKSPLRIGIVLTLAVAVLSFVGLAPANADTQLTTDQQNQIKSNCSLTKNTLNQLSVSDALLRVNRGQFYESMSSKLMDRFNARLSNNGIDNDSFVATTNDYNATLNVFRTDYQNYAQQLSNAIGIDCTKQPTQFYDAISTARDLRNKVHGDVLKLNEEITDYQTTLSNFLGAYLQPAGATQ